MPTLSAGLPIPPVSTETQIWIPSSPSHFSRSEIRRQSGSYESALPAPMSDWSPTLSSDLSADIEDATKALIEFGHHAALTLGPESEAIGPMSAILLRSESASSSQIEGLTVSAKQLALAEIDAGDSPNSRTVIGNVRAMESALAMAEHLSVDSILAMHWQLLQHQRGMEQHAGMLREELVWIGKGVAGPRQASFVAPQAQHVRPALEDLLAFTDRVDLPILMQIAVTHAQFETIHPFVDGNGRTGRALVQAQLRGSRLVETSTVPLSAGLLAQTEAYFASLEAFRMGDAEPVVRAFAQAARYATVVGGALIEDLGAELQESRALLGNLRPQAAAWRLLPHFVGQPIMNSDYAQRVLAAGPVTANRALDVLVEKGVVFERSGKKRGRIWEHRGILAALENFADTVKRPAPQTR